MKRRLGHGLTLISAALLLETCTSDQSPSDTWAGSVDTLPSGRLVVHNPDAPLWKDGEAWTLRERFRLGSLEGDAPDLFGRISGLALGTRGEVYVLDGQASEVRVFGSDGAHQRTFGRSGEGPGEFSRPGGLALDAEGTLWVMNWGNARYTGFDPSTGELRREVRRLASFGVFPWPGAFERGVRLLDVSLDRNGQPAIIRLDTAFVPADTMALPQPSEEDRIMFRRGGVQVMSAMEPFAPQAAWAPRPLGGIVLGEGAVYRLHRIDFDGDTSMTIELGREPARVTDAERDSALAVFEETATAAGGGATPDRRPRARGTKPAHGALFVDDRDYTWVRSVPPAGATPTWDVFAPDGRFLGPVEIPVPLGFLRPVVRTDHMAVATEMHGIPVVVVYDLVKGVQ
jgi:hypothetical protein